MYAMIFFGRPSAGTRRARRAWAAARRKHANRVGLFEIEIQHDDWCPSLVSGGPCMCNPVRVLKDGKGRILARVEGAGSYNTAEEAALSLSDMAK